MMVEFTDYRQGQQISLQQIISSHNHLYHYLKFSANAVLKHEGTTSRNYITSQFSTYNGLADFNIAIHRHP